MMTKEEILKYLQQEEVEFIHLQFTDMFGELKNIVVTANQLEMVLNYGYIIRGNAMCGGYNFETEDLYLIPDLKTFVVLPWCSQQGKSARFLCDVCEEDGTAYEWSPRRILQKVIEKTKELGYTFRIDPDCEFFAFHLDENGNPTTITYEKAGLMDSSPMDQGEQLRQKLVWNLEEMGFAIESFHHELAPAQHEMDFKPDAPMEIADAIVTFKSVARSIARREGMHVTFMPKPRSDREGSGMHLNFSVYRDGENLFQSNKNKIEYRDELNWFVGGIMKYAPEMCCITNPLVNSYKRLMSEREAPKNIVWTHKNLNALIKVQTKNGGDTRACLRFPDPSANPYLAIAVCIAAGVAGIEDRIEAGPYIPQCFAQDDEIKQLPGTLREAIACLKNSQLMREVLGDTFVTSYVEAKIKEWDAYMTEVSKWELEKYLNRI